MDIHFLGTTGYHPNQTQHTMCIMIPELGIVLDAGTGMFRVRERLVTENLTILLSHAHLDHVVGLTFLFDILYGKECLAEVLAEQEKLSAIEEHLFAPSLFPVAPPYQSIPLEHQGSEWSIRPGVTCRWIGVEHPGGAVAYRLDWEDGRSVAYVTDTTAEVGSAYESFLNGVELLIHECYFPDGQEQLACKTGHSCLTPVARMARRVGARKTALVHLNPLSQWAPRLDQLPEDLTDLEILIPEDEQIIRLEAPTSP